VSAADTQIVSGLPDPVAKDSKEARRTEVCAQFDPTQAHVSRLPQPSQAAFSPDLYSVDRGGFCPLNVAQKTFHQMVMQI